MALPEVDKAISKLFKNLDGVEIPLTMLKQYMPEQFIKVREGGLKATPRELVKDKVVGVIDDYNYAVMHNYMVSGIFTK